MKMWKRIITSLIRRPYQGLFVLLIVFVLGNVLFASIAIQQSSKQVKAEMRDRINGEITITYDFDNRRTNEVALYRMRDFIKEIESTSQDYEYKLWKRMYIDSDLQCLIGIPTIEDALGELNIVEGRNYTQEDFASNDFKIVLTEAITGLQVGDIIKIPLYSYQIEQKWIDNKMQRYMFPCDYVEFEIIGIANGYNNFYDENFERLSTYCVVPITYLNKMEVMQEAVFAQLSDEEKEVTINFNKQHMNWYRTAGYFITDLLRMEIHTEGMNKIERIENDIKHDENYARGSYVFKSSTTDYLYVQAPLENLEALSNVTLWSSVVLVITILSLVSVLFIRTRKYEIGILLSLGESKLKVVLQFVLEVMLVGLLATSCAMVTGNKLGEVISNEFLKMQIDADAEMLYEKEQGDVVTQLDMLESYTMELDSEYIITIYLASTGVLLISSLLPMMYIIYMKPKNIMLN